MLDRLNRLGERVGTAGAALALRARPRVSVALLMLTEECDSRCKSCSYRLPAPGEIGLEGMMGVVEDLAALGTRDVALTGGEPLVIADLPRLLRRIRELGMRPTLLTNGLKLAERAAEVVPLCDEIIVSLDGWDATSYRRIRGVDGFDLVGEGVRAARAARAERAAREGAPDDGAALPAVRARTTLQRGTAGQLVRLVDAAQALGFDTISLLAVDPGPLRFGRARERPALVPEEAEIAALREAISQLAARRPSPFFTGFILEDEAKLRRVADHLAAAGGDLDFPAKRCNAPLVSLVVGPRGEVRPCFFKPPVGSLKESSLREVLTGTELFRLRSTLDVTRDNDCRPCVCPLSRPLAEVLR